MYTSSLHDHDAIAHLKGKQRKPRQKDKTYRVVIMGSACEDSYKLYPKDRLTEEGHIKFLDQKEDNAIRWKEAGGGAINVAENLSILAGAFNLPIDIKIVTKLGKNEVWNPAKDRHEANGAKATVLRAIENMGSTVSVLDIAEHPRRITPSNHITLREGFAGRMIDKGEEYTTRPSPEEMDAHLRTSGKHANTIGRLMLNADMATIHSKFLDEAAYAAQCAHDKTEVIIDYDRSTTDHPELARRLLREGHVLLAPDDALGPEMQSSNRFQLFNELSNNGQQYPYKLLAVSNGIEPIMVNSDHKNKQIPVALSDLECIDKNGAGDLRDAGFNAFRLLGMEFDEAVYWGSALSSFGTNYQGREWSSHLDEFMTRMLDHPFEEPKPLELTAEAAPA